MLSACYFFFVLFSYYLLRPVRETFGIERGWENLPWLMTGTLVVMLFANPVYAWLVSRYARRHFIPYTYRFFASNMLLFYAAFLLVPEEHATLIGYAFYIWLSVFNLFVVSIFWAFMADLWTREQGARLFGAVGVGGTLGAICGATATAWLAGAGVSAPVMMLLAIAPLELAVQCVGAIIRKHGRTTDVETCQQCGYMLRGIQRRHGLRICPECGHQNPDRVEHLRLKADEPGPGAWKGLTLIARSPYLALICLYMLLFTTTSTYLYLEQGRIIEETFPDPQQRTAAFANIDLWVNLLTLFTQLFITGRLIRAIGIGAALAIVPALTVVGFVGLMALPGFAMLVLVQMTRRGLHYAIDKPAREVLYTVVGQDARYKSKSFIDTFIYRAGDMAGAWTGVLFRFPIGYVAAPLAGVWMIVALVLGWRQRIEAQRHAPST